jgi:branched-chain amino acid transport system ATP-binding protein
MLELNAIHTYYGLSHVLFGVSITVSKGQIVCLLGRNGAGKSTTMRSIMGLTPPHEGNILFRGEVITGKTPHVIARLGIGYVPDDRRVFADLTVDENLEISERRTGERTKWNRETVYEILPVLRHVKSRRAGNLSGGEQQMLTLARALVTNPAFILLDEPTEGLAPIIVREIEDQVIKLRGSEIGILLAEQNVISALSLSDYGYIIDNGHIRYHGSIQELRENEEIRKRYLLV